MEDSHGLCTFIRLPVTAAQSPLRMLQIAAELHYALQGSSSPCHSCHSKLVTTSMRTYIVL